MKKTVLTSFLILCLISTVLPIGLSLNIQTVKASETIYIRADGSVEGTDKIVTVDNVTYTFTDNIYDEIVVDRDNIVVDGAGYILQGTGAWGSKGISLSGRSNVTMNNMKIKMFIYGIYLYDSSNSTISRNHITNNDVMGISLIFSSNCNSVSGNNITNCDYGIYVWESSDNTISECHVTNNVYSGIVLEGSSNNSISGNNITDNGSGIDLLYSEMEPHPSSNYNSILGNHITNNDNGVSLWFSANNSIYENNITANNDSGIYTYESSSNSIYHNQFGNNKRQISTYDSVNVWDNGVEGNYWSNYTGVDLDYDGIGDSPLVIDENNQDNYPLMGLFSDFDATPEYHFTIVSNSSISDFQFDATAFYFDVTGEDGTTGFCRISIPTALLNGTYKLYINNTEVPYTLLPCSNIAQGYLYFAYDHSTQNVMITTAYYELLNQYLQLVIDFNSLNASYDELLNGYSELQSNHDLLCLTYYELVLNHTLLQDNYDSLMTSYNELQEQHNNLNSTYNNLLTSYNNLQTDYNELQSKQEAIMNELSNIRDIMYSFIAAAIFFIITTVYFAIRKPKIGIEAP